MPSLGHRVLRALRARYGEQRTTDPHGWTRIDARNGTHRCSSVSISGQFNMARAPTGAGNWEAIARAAVYFRRVPGPSDRPPVLIVCHGFPPYRGIGGRRWAKFAKALAQRGRPVHVIACAPDQEETGSLWTADIERPGITVHRLPRRYPKVMYQRPLTGLADKVAYRFWNLVLPWITKGNHFDKTVFWRKQLLEKAGALIREHGIRDVIVSGAPFRLIAHMAGLRAQHDLRLTAEVRDPWTWEAGYGWNLLTPRQQREERAIEASALAAADRVIAPSENFIAHLCAAYPGLKDRTVHIPHAVDAVDLPSGSAAARTGTELHAIIAGSFYDRPLSAAFLAELARSVSAIAQRSGSRTLRIDIHATTAPAPEFIEAIRSNGTAELIRFQPPLPTAELYARLQQADFALSYHPPARRDLVATKFSEYLLLGVPLLFVSEAGMASRFIEQRGGGLCIPIARLRAKLDAIASGELTLPRPDPKNARDLLLEEVTTRLEREVLA